MRLVDLDDLIAIENVSALAGVSNPTVLQLVKRGELPAPYKIGPRCSMFSRSAVRAALGLRDDPLSSERLTSQAAAALLGVSVQRLRTMGAKGEGPPAHRQGKRGVRFLRHEVLAYLEATNHPAAVGN
jgi:predicted DNA-binding transcriptional regulator AlpA